MTFQEIEVFVTFLSSCYYCLPNISTINLVEEEINFYNLITISKILQFRRIKVSIILRIVVNFFTDWNCFLSFDRDSQFRRDQGTSQIGIKIRGESIASVPQRSKIVDLHLGKAGHSRNENYLDGIYERIDPRRVSASFPSEFRLGPVRNHSRGIFPSGNRSTLMTVRK